MRLHTRNGPLQWAARDSTSVHAALGDAFYDVGHDADNRVVIMTGTGDEFLTALDAQEPIETFDADTWARIHREGRDLLMNLLDIEVPIIAAVNGPVLGHAELPMMSDIIGNCSAAAIADCTESLNKLNDDSLNSRSSVRLKATSVIVCAATLRR